MVASLAHAEDRFDIVIQNGKIVDGTGAPWYFGDIAIDDGKIVRIGNVSADLGEKVVDAAGLVVAPGFIDMMGQTAQPMLENPKTAINLLTQGITTINAGEGHSSAPLSDEEGKRFGWTTMREYFAIVDMTGLPVNVVQTVGHTQVRRLVLGEIDRRPSPEELEQMQGYVREAMEAGAIGVSTALIYPPAVYAAPEEIAALVSVAGEYGGRYYTHMRNEGDRLLEAIDEALEIGATGKAPVHIFHLKAAGRKNWGKMQEAIARIKSARASGNPVTADIYPYINNGLGIAAIVPPEHFAEGFDKFRNRLKNPEFREALKQEIRETSDWENWYLHVGQDWNKIIIGQAEDPRYAVHAGKSVEEIAKACDEDVWETFFHLVETGAFALPESMTDANKVLAMQQEFVSFCTDVGPNSGGEIAFHPRAAGSFPRMLSKYVRGLGAISLERAIAQASAAGANAVMAYDRGRIAEGLAADIIVFDYENLTDRATFDQPSALSEGMKHVIVNGRLVLEDGKQTDARPGRVLRGPGYNPASSPHHVSQGETPEGLSVYDTSIKRFLKKHRVPGVSVAVTDESRLVFAKGYGYADLEKQQPVTPSSLFRIASISKPITAVAILQLIEQGRLSLDDSVYSILDYETDIAQVGEKFDPRCRDITIRHLLEHRGGWDRDVSFDAMFRSVDFAKQVGVAPPADQQTVIRAMFSQSLDFDPGERYAYSNFGYCLLGRVIETISEQPYEHYVQEHVLAPIGIHNMAIGATRLDGRRPNEVRYYHGDDAESVFAEDVGRRVPSPYGAWHLEAMDSHGGWIASAVDLARFAAAFDDLENCPLLKSETIERMYARPPGLAGFEEDGAEKERYYSLGWINRVVGKGKVNHWHTGSLPGTATILIRRYDGKNFVALFNTRVSPETGHLGREFDTLLHEMANSVDSWPDHDLFEEFE
ncbi:MAG: serine hydrolase [Planctomycetaceae bacterium]|nr:serine hydrolase [Planctomycetaceae bacterium]